MSVTDINAGLKEADAGNDPVKAPTEPEPQQLPQGCLPPATAPIEENPAPGGPTPPHPQPAPKPGAPAPPPSPTFRQTVEMKFDRSKLSDTQLNAFQNIFSLWQKIPDSIVVDAKPYVSDAADAALSLALESRVFQSPLPATGLVVVQYPDDEEVLDVLGTAALAAARRGHAASCKASLVVVEFEREPRDWLNSLIKKVIEALNSEEAIIGIMRALSDSDIRRMFIRSYQVLGHLDYSLKAAGKLLLVFLEGPQADDEGQQLRSETRTWLNISIETVLSAWVDRDVGWVKEVKRLIEKHRGASTTYLELRRACEAASAFGDLAQYAASLQDDENRARKFFAPTLQEMHDYKVETTFDLIAIFIAAYLPGLSVSNFARLATRVLNSLPPPPVAGEDAKPAWPSWTPRELRRLTDKGLVELKTGADGSRRIYCTSSTVTATIRGEFEHDYICLSELRRDLLSDTMFAEGLLSPDQMVAWIELAARSQTDDPAASSIRQLANTFATASLRLGSKDVGGRTALAMTRFWSAAQGHEGESGLAADFFSCLLAEAGPQVALQTIRFCCRDVSNPIAPKNLLNWTHKVLRSQPSVPKSLVYAFVRDVLISSDAGRRDVFLNRFLDWISNEEESAALREVMRDSLANAILATVLLSERDSSQPASLSELPCVGGLPTATVERLLKSLAEDATIGIIDGSIRLAFGAAEVASADKEEELDWLELPSAFILPFLLAEWRDRLAGENPGASNEGHDWLRTLIRSVTADRDRRRLFHHYFGFVIDLMRHIKAHYSDRNSRQMYVQLIHHLTWIRAQSSA